MRFVYALAVALGLLVPPAADETVAVPALIDVVVADARGRDVPTLTAADFSVTEGGAPLTIRNVRYVREPGGAGAPPPREATGDAVSGDGRVFAFYLDEFHVTPGPAADRARDELVRFVRDALSPSDLVVVLKPLESLLAIHASDDRSAAAAAIESFVGRRGDYTPRTAFERDFIAGAPARAEISRAQISVTALNALVTHLGRMPSTRKTLVMLSEGFVVQRRRGEDFAPGFGVLAVTANRYHVSIYPIDPSPAAAPSTGPSEETTAANGDSRAREGLADLARDTSGAMLSPDTLSADLGAALREAAGYYVLSVSRGSPQPYGALHPVAVSLKRPGLSLRARKGYWSPSLDEARPAAPLSTALAVPAPAIPRRTSPIIRPWFGISRDADGDAQISFVWEPAPRVPGDRQLRALPARVGLKVTTPEGVPLYEGLVWPSSGLPSNATIDRQSQATFETSAGRLFIQMAIEDATARVVDHDVRDLLVVPPGGPVSVGTPRVFRSRTARDQAALVADLDAPPVAARVFSRAEQLLVRVPVFSNGADTTLTATLLSGLGGVMRDLAVTPVPSRRDLFQLDVPLATLPAGSYEIEFLAKTSAAESRDRLTFRVTP